MATGGLYLLRVSPDPHELVELPGLTRTAGWIALAPLDSGPPKRVITDRRNRHIFIAEET
jgi:hypothetical protein